MGSSKKPRFIQSIRLKIQKTYHTLWSTFFKKKKKLSKKQQMDLILFSGNSVHCAGVRLHKPKVKLRKREMLLAIVTGLILSFLFLGDLNQDRPGSKTKNQLTSGNKKSIRRKNPDFIKTGLTTIKNLNRSGYNRLLRKQSVRFSTGAHSNLGPVALSVIAEKRNRLKFGVKTANIRNLTLRPELVRLVVGKAGSSGKMRKLKRKSRVLNFSLKTSKRKKHFLKASNRLVLHSPLHAEQISRISGEIILSLPLKIKTMELNPKKINKKVKINNVAVRVSKRRGNKIYLDISDPKNKALGVYGVDRAGNEIAFKKTTIEKVRKGVSRSIYHFQSAPHKIKILTASSYYRKRFPFVMKSAGPKRSLAYTK